jgi:carboxyl-terminal processing protease
VRIDPVPTRRIGGGLFVLVAAGLLGAATEENDYRAAARGLDTTISESYAYLDRLPDGRLPQSDILTAEREAVRDDRSLLAYAEKRIATLADHHAITGSSFRDSWAVVPTFADIWVVRQGDRFVVDAVRNGSPAAQQGIAAGDVIVGIDGVPAGEAVSAFWAKLGLEVTPARADYAARVVVAGRRDRARTITVQSRSGEVRELVLPSLYDRKPETRPPVSSCTSDGLTLIRVNNSLGDTGTIAAFDAVMRNANPDNQLVLDLRDTPSGGNTTVARAIMGWFVREPRGYQIHNRPAEERETGIPRQWIEQVLPREGRHHPRMPIILVGRWTGSMGEGLAVGFAALGARVQGTPMARLLGSVEDVPVGKTNLVVKLPTERLYAVDGRPREAFVPEPLSESLSDLRPCQD